MSTSAQATDRPLDGKAFDLFNVPADYFQEPFEYFARLRDDDPVHRNADGTVLLSRYADVRAVWRDPTGSVAKDEMFRAKFGEGPLLEHHITGMLFRDPPDHDRLRKVVNPYFTPAAIERLRPFVEELVDGLVDELVERSSFDFVTDFATRIPIAVICHILGVPSTDGDYLRDLGRNVLFPLNPRVSAEAIQTGHDAAAAFEDYMSDVIAHVRARHEGQEPGTVVEALVAGAETADLTDSEIVNMCLLMLNGGHETTANLIAVGTYSLLQQPDQFRLFADRREDLAQPVEELVRFVSPLQLQGRRLTRPIEVTDEELPAGTEIVLCQAAANRDGRAFDEPDRIDLTRRPNAHVAFGLGAHLCIGRVLARLEGDVAFSDVARRMPGIELAGPIEWNRNIRFRGLRSMPVRVG
jgi:cytochrome P450